MISQGKKAVKSGQKLENTLEEILINRGIQYSAQVVFTDCYNNPRSKMDFYIPELDLAIECKRQMVSGTADQKLPFAIANLAKFPARKGLVVLSGDHYHSRAGIAMYLNSQVSDVFNWCFVEDFPSYIEEIKCRDKKQDKD